MRDIKGNLILYVYATRISWNCKPQSEMSIQLCHIDVIAGTANDERMHGPVFLCPEPENKHDSDAMAVHDVDGQIGFVSKRFTGLAREEYNRGSRLKILFSLSRRVWYCSLS
jgi:hypothetical protein